MRRQDLVEACHHDQVGLIRAQGTRKCFGIGIGRDLDGASEVAGDPRDQVRLGMGPLPSCAADGGHEVDSSLDQMQQERRAVVGRDSAEDHAEPALVESGATVWSAGDRFVIDRHHRELRLRPDLIGQVVQPGIFERTRLGQGGPTHAMARRTMGGSWPSSPYAQPSRSITCTTGMSRPARCSPMEICRMQPGLAEAITCAPESMMWPTFEASAASEISGWVKL